MEQAAAEPIAGAAPTAKSKFVISGTKPQPPKVVQSPSQDGTNEDGLSSRSEEVPPVHGRKSPSDKGGNVTESEAIDILVNLGLEAEADDASNLRDTIYTASDEEILRQLSSKATIDSSAKGSIGDSVDGLDGLILLASCVPPSLAKDMPDSERLSNLQNLVKTAGLSPNVVLNWTIARSKTNSPIYVTETGIKLRANTDVSEHLGFSEVGSKLAELMDYLEERQVAFDPTEWRAEERRRPDGKRTGFCFLYVPQNRMFYARNKVADYLEAKQFKPGRGRKKRKDKETFGSNDAPSQEATGADTTKKKRRRRYKVGDTVRVDYEGTVYDAIIVDTPAGMPTVDPEDGEALLSVFYLTDHCFEHGVARSRLLGHRGATQTDEDIFEMYEKGELQADTKEGATPKSSKIQSKGKKDDNDEGHSKKKFKRKLSKDEDEPIVQEEVLSPRSLRKQMKFDEFSRFVDDDPELAKLDELDRIDAFLITLRERIGTTSPKLYQTILGSLMDFRQGLVSLESLITFVVDAFGEDDTDLVRKFNIFLPPPLKITPKQLRQRWLALRQSDPASDRPLLKRRTQSYEEFIELVRFRFRNDPAGIIKFREMMAQFELDRRLDILCREAEYLFTGHPDLIAGLNEYLPPSHKVRGA